MFKKHIQFEKRKKKKQQKNILYLKFNILNACLNGAGTV